MKTVLIEMIDSDISRAGTSCSNCPIARAISRQFPGFHVSVNYCSVFFRRNYAPYPPSPVASHAVQTSEAMCEFIDRYDSGVRVSPISFSIEVPLWMTKT